jgi:hypothetical protein
MYIMHNVVFVKENAFHSFIFILEFGRNLGPSGTLTLTPQQSSLSPVAILAELS